MPSPGSQNQTSDALSCLTNLNQLVSEGDLEAGLENQAGSYNLRW